MVGLQLEMLKKMNPVGLTTRIFPLLALAIALLGYFWPGVLNRGGFLIVPFLSFIMLGMGATLSLKDFAHAIHKPRAVLIGMTLQFGIMPLWALLIGKAFQLDTAQLTGLVLVGAVSGGTASNVITFLAGGDVALSITMTACSTLAGIVLTPLLTELYLGQSVPVPIWAMFKSILLVVALPVSLGLLINCYLQKYRSFINAVCPVLSMLGIVLVIGIIIAVNHDNIRMAGAVIFAAVILHNLSGMALGYGCARLFKCDRKTAITIAIETGMQNSGLAVALAKQCFSLAAALPGALFSVWHNISGALLAALLQKLAANAVKKAAVKQDLSQAAK